MRAALYLCFATYRKSFVVAEIPAILITSPSLPPPSSSYSPSAPSLFLVTLLLALLLLVLFLRSLRSLCSSRRPRSLLILFFFLSLPLSPPLPSPVIPFRSSTLHLTSSLFPLLLSSLITLLCHYLPRFFPCLLSALTTCV